MGVKPPGPPFFLFFGRSFPDDGSLPLVPAAYFAEEGSCGGRGDPRREGSVERNRWWVVSRERFGVGRSIHVGRRLFCSSRETENERRETLCFSSRRALSRFVRGAESPPRIAPNRESRFFAETVRGREARGAGSARDRASRDVGGCRRDERVVSSRRASRARSRREPGGRRRCGDARGGHRASSGGPVRSPAPTRDGPTRREALRRARGIPSGRRVAEHTHRARHVPPGRGREAET